jgi:hypothetical protein
VQNPKAPGVEHGVSRSVILELESAGVVSRTVEFDGDALVDDEVHAGTRRDADLHLGRNANGA